MNAFQFKALKKGISTGAGWLVGSGVLAIATLTGGWWYLSQMQSSSEAIAVQVMTVERDTVEVTLNASGIVRLLGQQTLTSPVEGAVEQVLVQAGDRVQAGDVLITLRNPERQTALLEQQLEIDRQLVEVERAQQRIREAQEQLQADREDLDDRREFAAEGIIPGRDVISQENQVRTAEANLRTAESEAANAQLQLESLQLERQRLQQELDNTVIIAPITGVILGVDVRNGDGIELRTELLTLGDPRQELVSLQLSTLDAAQVEVGQQARVSVIGPDPEIFLGEVVSLYPQAVPPPEGSSDQSNRAIVPTIVQLQEPTRTLIPGSQVNVEIVQEQREDVVMIGVDVIQGNEADPFVWVLDGEQRAQQQPIALGLEGLVTVEVMSGLEAGDQIILPAPGLELEPGLPVDVETTIEQDGDRSDNTSESDR